MADIISKIKNLFPQTANKLKSAISNLVQNNQEYERNIVHLENTLLSIDCGPKFTKNIISQLKKIKHDALLEYTEDTILRLLEHTEKNIHIRDNQLNVFLVCGVNGTGKTSFIGKLGWHMKENLKKKVLFAACDTFRAAATNQLKQWGEDCQIDVISKNDIIGNDKNVAPSTVAYQSVVHAKENQYDVLLIDTSGRLGNNEGIMKELQKMARVIKKIDDTFPNEILMVLDSNSGQNTLSQVSSFKQFADITGLVITKLDSSSKGGIILSITEEYKLPIYFITLGEGKQDIEQFSAKKYTKALFN